MRRSAAPAIFLLAMALAAAAYAPALNGRFISDDTALVRDNPAIRSWSAAFGSFGRSFWSGLKDVSPYYRPLVILSYAADHALAGPRPALFHATNILLHALCAALAGLLVIALLPRAGPGERAGLPEGRPRSVTAGALLAAALAAVHPIHSEPVAAIYGRPDLLAALFTLAFANLALRGRTGWALLALGGALFSKESAGIIPLLALALFLGVPALGGRRRRILPAALGSVLLLAGYLAARAMALGGLTDPSAISRLDSSLPGLSPLARWMTTLTLPARYMRLWLWPSPLCADRGHDTLAAASGPGDPWVLAGTALLAAALLVLWLLRRRAEIWVPVAFAVAAYLPVSNLVLLAPSQMAERFLYLPSLFGCVLAGTLYARMAGGAERSGRLPGWPFGAAGLHLLALVLILAGGIRVFLRAPDFRDELSFHGGAAAACPSSAKAQYNLGNALATRDRHGEAVRAFERAVSVAPWLGIAHTNMGNSFLELRRLDDAERAYRKAIQVSPHLMNPHASLAGVLYMKGRLEAALDETSLALERTEDPGERGQLEELQRRIRQRISTRPQPSR